MQIESFSKNQKLYFRKVEQDTAGENLIFSASGEMCQVYKGSVGGEGGQVGINCTNLDSVIQEVVKNLGKVDMHIKQRALNQHQLLGAANTQQKKQANIERYSNKVLFFNDI